MVYKTGTMTGNRNQKARKSLKKMFTAQHRQNVPKHACMVASAPCRYVLYVLSPPVRINTEKITKQMDRYRGPRYWPLHPVVFSVTPAYFAISSSASSYLIKKRSQANFKKAPLGCACPMLERYCRFSSSPGRPRRRPHRSIAISSTLRFVEVTNLPTKPVPASM